MISEIRSKLCKTYTKPGSPIPAIGKHKKIQMDYIFYLISVFIAVYSIFCKYRVDIFMFSIWVSFLYLHPAFFGYCIFEQQKYPIEPCLYLIYNIFLLTMFLCHLCNNFVILPQLLKNNLLLSCTKSVAKEKNKIFGIYNFIYLFTTALCLFSIRNSIFANKTATTLTAYTKPLFILFSYHSIPYLMLSIKNRKKTGIILGTIIHIIIFIKGYRSFFIIFILSCLFTKLNFQKINFKTKIYSFIPLLLVSMFGLLGKRVYYALQYIILRGDSAALLLSVLTKDNLISEIFSNEAFTQMGILNLTVKHNITLPLSYIMTFIYKSFFVEGVLIRSEKFYDVFLKETNTYVEYGRGIAYNIFSEPYAMLGLLGVFLFTLTLAGVYFWLQKAVCLPNKNKLAESIFYTLTGYLTFYIHRNSINNLILFTQIYIGFYLLCKFLSGSLSIKKRLFFIS